MDAITLRPAAADDFAFFFALHKVSLGPYVDQVWGWQDDDQRSYLERNLDLSGASVIVVDGADVGRLDVEDHGDELFLALIEIAAEHQCHGIGARVIQTLLNEAFTKGKRVRLSVLQVNTRARQLYKRLGFTEVLRQDVAPETRIQMVAQPGQSMPPAPTARRQVAAGRPPCRTRVVRGRHTSRRALKVAYSVRDSGPGLVGRRTD